jgi:hypothetical protein
LRPRPHLRVRDRLIRCRPVLPGDFDVNGRLVNALLPGQLVRVEPQPTLSGRLQSTLSSPTRLCLCRRSHWDHLFLDRDAAESAATLLTQKATSTGTYRTPQLNRSLTAALIQRTTPRTGLTTLGPHAPSDRPFRPYVRRLYLCDLRQRRARPAASARLMPSLRYSVGRTSQRKASEVVLAAVSSGCV